MYLSWIFSMKITSRSSIGWSTIDHDQLLHIPCNIYNYIIYYTYRIISSTVHFYLNHALDKSKCLMHNSMNLWNTSQGITVLYMSCQSVCTRLYHYTCIMNNQHINIPIREDKVPSFSISSSLKRAATKPCPLCGRVSCISVF